MWLNEFIQILKTLITNWLNVYAKRRNDVKASVRQVSREAAMLEAEVYVRRDASSKGSE